MISEAGKAKYEDRTVGMKPGDSALPQTNRLSDLALLAPTAQTCSVVGAAEVTAA